MIGPPELSGLVAKQHKQAHRHRQNRASRSGLFGCLLHGAVISYGRWWFARSNSRDDIRVTVCDFLLHAETVEQPYRHAIIAVALRSGRGKPRALIIEFDQANSPASLEPQIHAASAHPREGVLPTA